MMQKMRNWAQKNLVAQKMRIVAHTQKAVALETPSTVQYSTESTVQYFLYCTVQFIVRYKKEHCLCSTLQYIHPHWVYLICIPFSLP